MQLGDGAAGMIDCIRSTTLNVISVIFLCVDNDMEVGY